MICEAALSVPWRDRTLKEGIYVLYAQNTALDHFFAWDSDGNRVYTVRFDPSIIQTDQMYDRYFRTWDNSFECFQHLVLKDYSQAQFNRFSPRIKFMIRTSYMTWFGFSSLRSLFYQYAMPIAMDYFRRVSYLVDPKVFQQARHTVIQ